MFVGNRDNVLDGSLYISVLDSAKRMFECTRKIIFICLLAALHCRLDGVG